MDKDVISRVINDLGLGGLNSEQRELVVNKFMQSLNKRMGTITAIQAASVNLLDELESSETPEQSAKVVMKMLNTDEAGLAEQAEVMYADLINEYKSFMNEK